MNAIILDFIFNNRYVLTALLWFVAILPVVFLIRSSEARKLRTQNRLLAKENEGLNQRIDGYIKIIEDHELIAESQMKDINV